MNSRDYILINADFINVRCVLQNNISVFEHPSSSLLQNYQAEEQCVFFLDPVSFIIFRIDAELTPEEDEVCYTYAVFAIPADNCPAEL